MRRLVRSAGWVSTPAGHGLNTPRKRFRRGSSIIVENSFCRLRIINRKTREPQHVSRVVNVCMMNARRTVERGARPVYGHPEKILGSGVHRAGLRGEHVRGLRASPIWFASAMTPLSQTPTISTRSFSVPSFSRIRLKISPSRLFPTPAQNVSPQDTKL